MKRLLCISLSIAIILVVAGQLLWPEPQVKFSIPCIITAADGKPTSVPCLVPTQEPSQTPILTFTAAPEPSDFHAEKLTASEIKTLDAADAAYKKAADEYDATLWRIRKAHGASEPCGSADWCASTTTVELRGQWALITTIQNRSPLGW